MDTITEQLGGGEEGMRVLDSSPRFIDKRREALVTHYDLTYISYGAGVQSTALLVCSNLGLHGVPKADVAIFADTGDEPEYIYEYLEVVKQWSDIPIEVCQYGVLSEDSAERLFACVPAYSTNKDGSETLLRRQCTREYKITPIEKHVRELLGYEKGQRVKHKARCLLGISRDEASRMKPSRTKWIVNEWPLVDALLRRSQCVEIVESSGLPSPFKSSCTYCPFHSDKYFAWLRDNHPVDFESACKFDDMIRDKGQNPGMGKLYVHRSRKPLREAKLDSDQLDLFDNECEGYCGL